MIKSALRIAALLPLSLVLAGCFNGSNVSDPGPSSSLPQARKGFVTHLTKKVKANEDVPAPPAGFKLVYYNAPLGSFPAYITSPKRKPGKHPAIIWISGGFDNSIGDTPWAPATADNDQSARAFPAEDIVTMYPSLRGGNHNAGYIEDFLGEADDVITAEKFLAGRPEVDPHHIYLGGHSTGGTLALLVAESTNQFRAVFAFGPVGYPAAYGNDNLNFDPGNIKEDLVRSPILYLDTIKSPTYVFEGMQSPSNISPLHDLAGKSQNSLLHFYQLSDYDHFSELAPITPVIASAIKNDTGALPNFKFVSIRPSVQPVTENSQ